MRKILAGRRGGGKPFVIEIDVSKTSAVTGAAGTFKIPVTSGTPTGGGALGFSVDWGDGTVESVNSGNFATAVHTYNPTDASYPDYTIKCNGSVRGWSFGQMASTENDALKVMKISDWGNFIFTESECFQAAGNLNMPNAVGGPLFEGVKGGDATFRACVNLQTINNIENWNVSNVTSFNLTFDSCRNLTTGTLGSNIDLSAWDVSNSSTFKGMFSNALSFNGNMFSTVSSTCTDLAQLFLNCRSFNNGTLATNTMNSWITANVTDLTETFSNALAYDENISNWDVKNVKFMERTFSGCSNFNQPIGVWDTTAVTNAGAMFFNCFGFVQDISSWNMDAISVFNNAVPALRGASGSFNIGNANYNALLIAWDAFTYSSMPANSIWDFGQAQYTLANSAVVNARASLVIKWGGINDGGGI